MKYLKIRNIFFILIVGFISITTIGFSMWLISNSLSFKPIYNIDPEWEKYLGGQTKFIDSDILLPDSRNTNILNISSSNLNGYSVSYKLQSDTNGLFITTDSNNGPEGIGSYLLKYTKGDEFHIITFYIVASSDWVCYLDSESNKYASIEEALAVAKADSNANYVFTRINQCENAKYGGNQDIDIIIRSDCEIAKGDTLFLQCGLVTNRRDRNKSTVSGSSTDTDGRNYGISETDPINKANCKVIIAENVILTNNGTLDIDGQLSSGYGSSPSAGHTCGIDNSVGWEEYSNIKNTSTENVLYSILCLEDNAIINSFGNVYCYGFLYELSLNNGSQLIMNSGTLYMPFCMKDFGGGSSMRAVQQEMAARKSSPFNEFCFENVSCFTTFKFNASFIAFGNLWAGSQHNSTLINFISNKNSSNDAVIEFTDEMSYLTTKYNPITQVNELNTYGSFKTNPLSLSIRVIVSVTIKTDIVYFPITWRFKLTLNANENNTYVDAQQIFKIMPGATVIVEKGVLLYVKELVIYTKYEDNSAMSKTQYKKGLDGGNFIVNGTVETDRIAGKVKSTTSGAKLTVADDPDVSNETSIRAYEPNTHVADTLSSKVTSWTSINEVLEVKVLTSTGVTENYVSASVGEYISKKYNNNDEYAGWYSNTLMIYFNSNGGNFTGDIDTMIGPIQKEEMLATGGYLINFENISVPLVERENYKFVGWYLDSNKINEADGSVIYISTTLYAIWEPIEYNISYDLNNFIDFPTTPNDNITAAFTNEQLASLGLPLTYNIEGTYELPVNTITYSNYVFSGWYLKNNEGQLIKIEPNVLTSDMLPGGTIKIYGAWNPPETKKYTICINYSGTKLHEFTVTAVGDTIPIFDVANLNTLLDNDNNNPGKPTYYNHLDTTNYNVNSDGNIILDDTMVINGVITFEITGGAKIALKYFDTESQETPTLEYHKGETSVKLRELFGTTNEYKTVWFANTVNSDNYYLGGTNITISTNIPGYDSASNSLTLYGTKYWQIVIPKPSINSSTDLAVSVGNKVFTISNNTLSAIEFSNTSNGNIYFADGETITYSASITTVASALGYKNPRVTITETGVTREPNVAVSINADKNRTINSIKTSCDSCVTSDTLISLSDGSQKRIDELVGNENILVFNHETGKIESTKIGYLVEHDSFDKLYTITELIFSNGSSVKILGNHTFYNNTLGKYVIMNQYNSEEYIGDSYVYLNNGIIENVILANVKIYEEYTKAYSIQSYGTINSITNGILSSTPYLEAVLNAFEINNLTLKYENFENDVDKYGLFSYEELSDYMTFYEYDMVNAKYFKISINKGLFSYEELLAAINIYRSIENNIV